MFQFRRFPSYTYEFSIRYMTANHVDCSIRKSADQSVLTTPRGLSQLTTSFIGSWCQGIHPALFLTLPIFKWVSVLFKNCSFPTKNNFHYLCRFTRSFLNLHFSILFSSCSVLFQEQVSVKQFFFCFTHIHSWNGGHKWTRTTDLTLIRRAL